MLINCSNTSNYYLKTEDSILYSSPNSAAFNTYDSDAVPPRNSEKSLNSYFQQLQSNSTTENSCLSTSTISKSIDNLTFDNHYTNQQCERCT
ncbi:hypothetical protein CVS40_12854 [Lucilia cuprina]|nr:hypothetical protein CVS40_12854 [Lucilia cuprina]